MEKISRRSCLVGCLILVFLFMLDCTTFLVSMDLIFEKPGDVFLMCFICFACNFLCIYLYSVISIFIEENHKIKNPNKDTDVNKYLMQNYDAAMYEWCFDFLLECKSLNLIRDSVVLAVVIKYNSFLFGDICSVLKCYRKLYKIQKKKERRLAYLASSDHADVRAAADRADSHLNLFRNLMAGYSGNSEMESYIERVYAGDVRMKVLHAIWLEKQLPIFLSEDEDFDSGTQKIGLRYKVLVYNPTDREAVLYMTTESNKKCYFYLINLVTSKDGKEKMHECRMILPSDVPKYIKKAAQANVSSLPTSLKVIKQENISVYEDMKGLTEENAWKMISDKKPHPRLKRAEKEYADGKIDELQMQCIRFSYK